MHKEVSAKIIMILVTAAILTVPSSVVQYLHAQSDQGLQGVLNIHNDERGLVRVQPLAWSDSLASQAQSYADHLTTLGIVCGEQGCDPPPPHGANNENIDCRDRLAGGSCRRRGENCTGGICQGVGQGKGGI